MISNHRQAKYLCPSHNEIGLELKSRTADLQPSTLKNNVIEIKLQHDSLNMTAKKLSYRKKS